MNCGGYVRKYLLFRPVPINNPQKPRICIETLKRQCQFVILAHSLSQRLITIICPLGKSPATPPAFGDRFLSMGTSDLPTREANDTSPHPVPDFALIKVDPKHRFQFP